MNAVKTKNKKGKVKRVMLTVVISLAAVIFGLAVFRLIYREVVKAKHSISAPGIDLMETVEIGGIKQALYFRGENAENPVILYIHGGPASSEMPLLHGFQYDWEKSFTVVHWEQRQSGKTYLANNPADIADVPSFNRMVEDAWEVTQYIREKLGKDKITVLGHSWGTVLGTALVQTHSEAFSAYIGVGQIINWRENERSGYNLVLQKAKEAGNKKDFANLTAMEAYYAAPYDNSVFKNFIKLGNYKNKYGVGNGANNPKLALLLLGSPYASFKEITLMYKNDYWDCQDELFKYLFTEYDAYNFGTEYAVPVFYVQGENDFLASRELSDEFFGKINASIKKQYTIPNVGHMTLTDNPKEFARVLLEEVLPLISG